MPQAVITYNDIMHLNSDLYEQEIYYKLKYVDEHTAAIFSLGSCACDGKQGKLHTFVEEYFRTKGLLVLWSDHGDTFSVRKEVL